MADATAERLHNSTGVFPGRGTLPIAANTLLFKGQIVCRDSAGRAAVPGAGLPAAGVAAQTFDNRTGSFNGGAADAIPVEVEYGVFGFLLSGTAPKPGDIVYVVDNQTVSLDPTGSRGIAGVVSEYKDGLVYTFVNPVGTALVLGEKTIDVPLGSFRLATGAAIAAFANGGADGFTLADSEAICLRWNNTQSTAFWAAVRLPESLPVGATMNLHVLASRVGATDVAAVVLTPVVFANREGVAYDAGASLVTGDFGVIAGATKVVHELTKAIVGAQAGDVLSISLAAAAGLANDDLVVHGVWISAR
jgi:hypothetical protein